MEARHVPFNYAIRWITCAMEISQRYYSLFLGCGLLSFFSTILISIIPFLGGIASVCLLMLYTLANMRMVAQIRKTQTATFDDYLKYVFDPIVLQRFAPYLIILVVVSGAAAAASLLKITPVIFSLSLAANLLVMFFTFAAYMMLQNPTLTWQDAAKTVFKGVWQNILTWLCGGLLLGLFAGVCVALCGLPFLFYFIPMTLPVSYLMYASIFEGLDVDQTAAEWSSKSRAVQTLDAPRDGV